MKDVVHLWRRAGVRPAAIALAVAAAAVTLLSALALTVLSGWLITRAWQMPPVLALSVAITAVRALGISRAVFRYIDRIITHRLALSALSELRALVYDALVSGPGAARGAGHVYVVEDTERVTDALVRCLVPRAVALVLSATVVGVAAWLNPASAAVLAAALAVTGFAVPRLALRSYRRARGVEESNAFVSRLDLVLEHRVEFAAAGLGDSLIGEVSRASQRASRENLAARQSLAVAEALQTWMTGAAALGVAACAGVFYTGEPTWLGMLVMLSLAAFESHAALPDAARAAEDASRAAARLRALNTGVERTVDPPARTARVSASGLRTIHGDQTWDFSLDPGQRLLIRGPSGAGKTTMLQTVAGLLPAAAGTVTAPENTRFFAEDGWIFSTSVRENLRVAAPALDDATAAAVLDAVGLTFGLDAVLDNGAESLSAGQRRRLLLARALCSDAEVLLLDEPTAHLSPDDAEDILRMLLEEPLPGARAQRTVIVVAHSDGG